MTVALATGGCGRSSGGLHVAEEAPATATDLVSKPANNSPMLAADPTDDRFVALANRLDSPEFGCALQVSGDGGRSWHRANPVPRLPEGAEKCYAPEVAFDAGGRLLYLFVGLHGAGNEPMGAFLTTSSDRGRSFDTPRKILGPLNFGVRMAVGPGAGGRIHLVWLHAGSDPPLGGFGPPPNPIMAAYSDDGGETFSDPVQVSDPARRLVAAPALAVAPGGRVHVLYYDLKEDLRDYQGLAGPVWEGPWSLVMATSSDGGRSFARGIEVEPAVVPPERVMLIFTMPPAAVAVGPGGRVYAAWHDARNGDWDVFTRSSADGGKTWGGAVRVNDDPLYNGRHQYLPRLSVAPGGRLDALFYDRRGNIQNRGNDVTYTYSSDEGRSFAANRVLTSLNFDSRIGPRYAVESATGLFEFGSRIGLLSRKVSAVAAWTDTRNTGRGAPAQDIFSTTVELPKPGALRLWGWPAVLGAGGLAAAVWRFRGRKQRSLRRQGTVPGTVLSSSTKAMSAAVMIALNSCVFQQPALFPGPPVIEIKMDEMSFEHPASIPSGRVVFRMVNAGQIDHRLVLAPLPDDFPPLKQQLSGGDRRPINPVAGIPDRPPRATGAFAVDLKPGRYGLLCLLIDPDGASHAEKGMASELRVA